MEKFSLENNKIKNNMTGVFHPVHNIQGVFACKIPDLGMFKHSKQKDLLNIVNAMAVQIETRKLITEKANINSVLSKLGRK